MRLERPAWTALMRLSQVESSSSLGLTICAEPGGSQNALSLEAHNHRCGSAESSERKPRVHGRARGMQVCSNSTRLNKAIRRVARLSYRAGVIRQVGFGLGRGFPGPSRERIIQDAASGPSWAVQDAVLPRFTRGCHPRRPVRARSATVRRTRGRCSVAVRPWRRNASTGAASRASGPWRPPARAADR